MPYMHPYMTDKEADCGRPWSPDGTAVRISAGEFGRWYATRDALLTLIEKPCEGEENASDRLVQLRSLAKRIRG